ncbi:MAG: hypothetical protein ACYDEX_20905 [Mobilitalea sp.]
MINSKIHLSERDKMRLFITFALVILFTAYRFVYFSNIQSAKAIEKEISLLEVQESELQLKYEMLDQIEEENEVMSKEISEIINRYGTGASTEKTIMYLDNLEKESGMDINVISFSEPENIYTTSQSEESQVTAEGTTSEESQVTAEGATSEDGLAAVENNLMEGMVRGYNSIVSIDFKVSYEGLKKSINDINNNPERMNIREINLVYDTETGILSGSMKINMYHLIEIGSNYIAPEMASVDIGTSNIFGTIELGSGDEEE